MKFCPNCDQMVGLQKHEPSTGMGCLLPLVFAVLAVIVPFWPISAPIFGALAILTWFFAHLGPPPKCAKCGTPGRHLLRRRPK